MSLLHIKHVNVTTSNPLPFLSPFEFLVHYFCEKDFDGKLLWKMYYFGSLDSKQYDQLIGLRYTHCNCSGNHKFLFKSIEFSGVEIPDKLGSGAALIKIAVFLKQKELLRVGFYVTNSYQDPVLKSTLPHPPRYDKMIKTILTKDKGYMNSQKNGYLSDSKAKKRNTEKKLMTLLRL